MSKKIRPMKVSLPDDHIVRFWNVVKSLVEPFGIDRVKEVNHYVELLGEAVDRHVNEAQGKPSREHKRKLARKRFIAIFKRRYLFMTDFEYDTVLSGVEVKLIDQALDALEKKGVESDEYLKWQFETFLVDNPKFCPPNIKQMCSDFFLKEFFYANKESIKQKQQDEILKKEVLDLVARARVLIRSAGDKQEQEEVKKVLKAYRSGGMGVSELRKKIESMEG